MPFSPPIHHRLCLRDGTPVIVRPLLPDDRERATAVFNRLSPQSSYFRFFTRVNGATPQFIDRLCAYDPAQHATWIMVIDGETEIPGVGGGSFWRLKDDGTQAEVAFTIADEFQGQGAGNILLAVLWEEARAVGIQRFVAHMLGTNFAMRAWWSSLGATSIQHSEGVEMTLLLDEQALPDHSTADGLRNWLAVFRKEPQRGKEGAKILERPTEG